MVSFRIFRNTDPPALADIWNEAFPGRSTYSLPGCSALERCVFARLYFDPAGLILAEDEGRVVGFSHAGFGCRPDQSGIDPQTGVICLLAVRRSHRRRGIGTELLRRAEAYLQAAGAQRLFAGLHFPCNPFYLGLYGGAALPGILSSDGHAEAFLLGRGYQPIETTLVWHRSLMQPFRIVDPRFVQFRQQLELTADAVGSLGSWWQNSVVGQIEPLAFCLRDRSKPKEPVARALVWDLEGFSTRWCQSATGLLSLEVRPELRRQGVGKFLLFQLLRYLQDQYFQVLEAQVPASNEPGTRLLRSLGFEQVDVGKLYQRSVASA